MPDWNADFEKVVHCATRFVEESAALVASANKAAHFSALCKWIDDTLPQINDVQSKIHDSRITLSRLRNSSNSLVPISRLSNVLLRRIFRWGVKFEYEQDYFQFSPRRFTFARRVSQVCGLWRRVALKTKDIWASLDFLDGPHFHMTRRYLKRCGDTPLIIRLDTLFLGAFVDIAWTLLRRYKNNWKTLILYGFQDPVCGFVSELKNTPESLVLHLIKSGEGDQIDIQETTLLTPYTSVSLTVINAVDVTKFYKSATMTRVELNNCVFSPHILLNLLKECQLLEYLELHGCDVHCTGKLRFSAPTLKVTLAHVQQLKVGQVHSELVAMIFHNLSMPLLTRLSIDESAISEIDAVCRFLARTPKPSITNLEIVYGSCLFQSQREYEPWLKLGNLFKSLPSLEELQMFNCHVGSHIFQALLVHPHATEPLVCPRLFAIRLRKAHFPVEDLIAMLESRRSNSISVLSVQSCMLQLERGQKYSNSQRRALQDRLRASVKRLVWNTEWERTSPHEFLEDRLQRGKGRFSFNFYSAYSNSFFQQCLFHKRTSWLGRGVHLKEVSHIYLLY